MQILLLDMPHSGAPLVARVMQTMGITVAPEEARHLIDDDMSIYGEHSETGRLHQRVFESLEMDWNRVSGFHADRITTEMRQAFESQARALINEWDRKRHWILYDPSLCLLASLWRPLLDRPVYVYVYRHPWQIAQALHARYGYSIPLGMALWEKYTVQSLVETADAPRLLVSYHDLLKEPAECARRLYKRLRKMGCRNLNKPDIKALQEELASLQDPYDGGKELLIEYGNFRQERLCKRFRKGRLFGVSRAPSLSLGALEQLQAFEQGLRREQEVISLKLERGQKAQEAAEHEQTIVTLRTKIGLERGQKAQEAAEHEQTINTLRSELNREQAKLHRMIQWFEQLYYDSNALFQSWTWKLGRLLVRIACAVMWRRPGKTVREHIERIMADFNGWRSNLPSSPEPDEAPSSAPQPGLKHERIDSGDETTHPVASEAPAHPVFVSHRDANQLIGHVSENGRGLPADDTASTLPAPKSRISKTKILYISPNLPDFDTSSGGKRATRMLSLLAEECDVYAFTLGAKPDKHVRELTRHGVVVLDTFDYAAIKQRIPHLDTIIYAWYYTYQDCIRFTELYPEARVILDSVDVHWVREKRSLGLWNELTEEQYQSNKEKEIKAYRAADVVWAVTASDKAAILEEIPDADVRVVSNIHTPVVTQYQDPGNNTILFIGGYNHYPNISAAQKLALDIFPRVQKKIKDARLIIAGSRASEGIVALGDLTGVEFRGFVEEDEIEALYQKTFITAVPLLTGSGIKGKICESIVYRTPVVTNAIGNEGIDLAHAEEALIADDFDEMADLIIRAMKREYAFADMTEKACKKLLRLVGPEIVKARMLSSITHPVSVCIVTWNKLDLLKQCIESVVRNTIYCNYNILVYSNGCTDGTQEYLKEEAGRNPKIIPILSDKNDVFVKPNNHMMRMFPENDVVLINNDVTVTPNWLRALHRAAHASESYGIAGSKILYPDGRLQEFGSELYADGTGRNIGKWDDADKEDYGRLTEVGYVSGCAMYIKRSTIEKIGLFDEEFHPCYCEDSDYCYTAKEHGLSTVVTPESIVYHDEGSTAGTDTSKGFKAYQNINMQYFLKKHYGKNNGIDWEMIESQV